MIRVLAALCWLALVSGEAAASSCYYSPYYYSYSYYPTYSYCAPSYSGPCYSYHCAGWYKGRWYPAGYYYYDYSKCAFYLKGYGYHYGYDYAPPKNPTVYLPVSYRKAFFGTYNDDGPVYGGGIGSTTASAAAAPAARVASASTFEQRVLAMLDKIDKDGQVVKADVAALKTKSDDQERRLRALEAAIGTGTRPPNVPAMPRSDNGDAPPRTPAQEDASLAVIKAAHTAGTARCASCHTEGKLNKDTTFVLFVKDGRLANLPAAAKVKVVERLVEGTMPPKDAPPVSAEQKNALIAYYKEN